MNPTPTTGPTEEPVPAAHAGRRLDKYLRAQLKAVPAGLVFRYLRTGRIRVNGRKVAGNYRIRDGDVLTLPAMALADTAPKPGPPRQLVEQLTRAIVYEDDELLVVDKPAGVPVHAGTGHAGGVIEALRSERPREPDLDLAHRIDRETSGLLILTKTPTMLRYLSELFKAGDGVRREYTALVLGAWPQELTESTAPLAKSRQGMAVAEHGDPALTRFRVRERFGAAASLIEAELVTGRKHQIRVHTRHAGHPIAGDKKYGDPAFNQRIGGERLYLHATGVSFPLPDGDELSLSLPSPKSWRKTYDRLAGKKSSRRPNRRRRR